MTKLKKILFVSHDVNRAGAQLFLLSIMKYFKAKNLEIVLLALNDWGTLKSEFENDFAVYYLNKKQKKKSIFGKDLNVIDAIIEDHQIDFVYLNTIASAELLPELASKINKPIISHIHELQYSIAQFGSTNALSNLFQHSTNIIACSHAVSDNLKEYQDSEKIKVVHSFVENDAIIQLSEKSNISEIKKKYNISEDKIWISACGNADWRKAPDIFLQIAAYTLKRQKNIGFVWIGIKNEGEQFEQLQYDAKKLGIDQDINWINPTSDAVEIINACDVFLVSSREDPFPLVVLEAALCEKPILGFEKTGGVDEFIDDNCGYKVSYLDIYKMAEVISALDKSEIKSLGRNAKLKVLDNYSFDISIKKIEDIIDGLFS